MKRIFMTLSASATLVLAIALNSCNNAEEVKKQVEAQNAAIQTAVDEKLNALQEQVNAECTAQIDSLANVAFAAYQEEAAKLAKSGKKPTVKPKPAPKPKEEPKAVVDPKKDKMSGDKQTNVEVKKDKMSGDPNAGSTTDKKKSKMSGGK